MLPILNLLAATVLTAAFVSAATLRLRVRGTLFMFHGRLSWVWRHRLAKAASLSEFLIGIGLLISTTRNSAAVAAFAYLCLVSSFLGWVLARDGTRDYVPLSKQQTPRMGGVRLVYLLLRPAWFGISMGGLCLVIWVVLSSSSGGSQLRSVPWAIGAFVVCPTIVLIGLIRSIVKSYAELAAPEHPRRRQLISVLSPLLALSWYAHRED